METKICKKCGKEIVVAIGRSGRKIELDAAAAVYQVAGGPLGATASLAPAAGSREDTDSRGYLTEHAALCGRLDPRRSHDHTKREKK